MYCVVIAVPEDAKGIPEFWLSAMKNIENLNQQIQVSRHSLSLIREATMQFEIVLQPKHNRHDP